jgi:hypothetical protein
VNWIHVVETVVADLIVIVAVCGLLAGLIAIVEGARGVRRMLGKFGRR